MAGGAAVDRRPDAEDRVAAVSRADVAGRDGAARGDGIRVALFDLDDTLFAHRAAVQAGLAAHREALGGEVAVADADDELARWNALEESEYHRYLSGELDFHGQRRARARGFLASYPTAFAALAEDSAAEAWFDAYLVHYVASWTLHADALPCLSDLAARGLRIGLITNGDIVFQTEKIIGTGLTPHLEHVIASGSVGVAKPDPAIFAEACQVFDVPAAAALYVGDRLHTDAIGAARAGLLGVWLDRGGVATAAQLAEAAAEGVAVIRSLDELTVLLP